MSISTSNLPDSLIQLQNFVHQTDHDGVLQLISYDKCNRATSDEVKACRGLVYDGNKLLFPSLGYTDEYNCDESLPDFDLKESYIFPSYEGTLLRVFYHNKYDKWYVSTHRKLDAFYSRWLSAESFGHQFFELITENKNYNEFLESLDRSNVYLFLLRPLQENRLVCDSPSQNNERLLHVCTIKNREIFDFDDTIPFISKPYRLTFSSKEELTQYVNLVDFNQQQGVIIFYKNDKTIKQFKLMNSKYKEYATVRGNEHNLLIRYLQVRSVPNYYKMLTEIYPERVNEFYMYDSIILQLAKRIHQAYIQRFVKKQYVVVSPLEYQFIKDCHGWHISDREHNKVDLVHVLQTLSKQEHVSTLNTLIRTILSS